MWIKTGTIRSTKIQWLPVLANEAPLSLRRSEHTKRILDTLKNNPNFPLFRNIIEHPLKRLKCNKKKTILTGGQNLKKKNCGNRLKYKQ